MRKILAVLLLGMLFLYAFPMFALHNYAQSYPVDSWPTVQNDLANTGYSISTGPKTNEILWNYTASSYVWSDIAVSEGKIYFGSLDGIIYALDAKTGALAWNFTTGKNELFSDPILNGVFSSASIANGIVYIGSNDKNVYALN
jgi:outer membrane protein assembly factor BamB